MSGDDRIQRARLMIQSARSGERRLAVQRATATCIAIALIVVVTAVLIESLFHLPTSVRPYLSSIIIGSIAGGATMLFWGVRRNPLLKSSLRSDEFWALRLGELTSAARRDRLLNAIQVNKPRPGSRDNPSPELAAEALYRAVAEFEGVDPASALDPAPARRAKRLAAALSGGTLLLFLFNPAGFGGALERLARPDKNYDPPPEFRLSIHPSGGEVYRNEPVEFVIEADGAAPSFAEFRFGEKQADETRLEVRLKEGRATLGFDGFVETITYRAVAGNVTAGPFDLKVIPRPQIIELSVKLTPPPYTRSPERTNRENVGDIEALPGSTARIRISASKPLDAAWLLFTAADDSTGGDSLALSVSGREADLALPIMTDGSYSIRLRDSEGHYDRDPVLYRVRLLADVVPAVRILFPDSDVTLGDDMAVPLSLEADDDFGLSKWEVRFHQLEGDTLEMRWPLEAPRNARSLALDTLWRLGELAVMPGDVLEYWAVAWDNDDINGPKRGESERRLVRFPTFEEIVEGVEQAEETAEIDARKAVEAAKDLKEEVSKLVEEMRRDPKVDWERMKQVEGALEQQAKLEEQAKALAKSLDDLVSKLDKHNLLTPETLAKYQELQKLISEIATPELKAAMEKLKQAMEAQDPEQVRQALESFDMDREEFLKNIERTSNILQQLKLERKLDELAKRAADLLHQQEQALQRLKEGEPEGVPRDMELQAAGMRSLERELQDAAALSQEMGEQALAESLDSLKQDAAERRIDAAMEQTGALSRRGDQKAASTQAEETARDLASIASALQKLAEDFKASKKADLAQRVRRLVEELLFVSEGQEEVMRKGSVLGIQSPRYRDLAGDQQALRESLAGVAGRIIDLSNETFFITPELAAGIGRALGGMEKALESYAERSPRSAAGSQKGALGEINRTGLQLLLTLQELEGASSSSGYEEMIKKLSEMTSAQQGLNSQSMPSPMPMPGQEGQGGPPLDGTTMSRLAAQQRALQQQMEEAAQEAANIQEMLGDLSAIANQMGEVARDFEDKNITERTRRLQQQIVSRLLDATRSAREEEYSRKRESKTGEEIARKSPEQLRLNADKERLRRDLLRALQEGYSPDYRRLIQQYYEALQREALEPAK